ncbi:hypothetical protein C2G38_2280377 [Gigaspora rosea]|uniref:Uncharacterized protein n=1 Tax=Gigaspora rosea TaxID=44941 RepID=A0A397U5J6_9GLOM|nr:hypothetical protein C2G38_2280377 [Gigaspora rosea]
MADACASQNIKGHRLGSIREEELEKKIHDAIKSKAEINKLSDKLQDKYIKQMKAFDRERKGWNQDSLRNNTEIQKLRTHALQVINERKQLQNENTNLISHNTQKDIFIAESKAENVTKSKKIRSLESIIKILESKLSSAQKDVFSTQKNSSNKESEILSLKSKIAELEQELASTVSELKNLKSEAVSNPVVGGDDEKNVGSSSHCSAIERSSCQGKDLSQYFGHRKNMDQAEKIDTIVPAYINNEITSPPKVDIENTTKISNKINISKTNKDNILDISIKSDIPPNTPGDMNSHLAQSENNMFSSIKSNSQMRPSLEALPLPMGGIEAIPIVASTLISPLSAYIILILLVIAVIWFVVLRHGLSIGKKSDRL